MWTGYSFRSAFQPDGQARFRPVADIEQLRHLTRMARFSVGDVFLIPVDGERYGIGQLAGDWKGELYVVVFDKLVSQTASPADIDGCELVFAALTLDAKLYHGHWPVIGNRVDNLSDLPQPWFKVGVGGETHIESRDRLATRQATEAERAGLQHRTVVAPVRVEKALKALHGIGEWTAEFDELRATYALESVKLVLG